jgi:hypothetical protein
MSELKRVIHADVFQDGNIPGNVSLLINNAIKSFAGHVIDVVIDIRKSKPSERQDGYYFGCVIKAEQDAFKERFGEILSKASVHEFNKANFFVKEILNQSSGEVVKIPQSHLSYNKSEFEEKLEQIRQYFLINLDWRISLPNEYSFLDD